MSDDRDLLLLDEFGDFDELSIELDGVMFELESNELAELSIELDGGISELDNSDDDHDPPPPKTQAMFKVQNATKVITFIVKYF